MTENSLSPKYSRKFWARWRVRLGYPVAIIYWLLADPTPTSIFVGGLIAAVGLFIRGSAAGHLRKDKTLATSGPYAQTRNPLYLGSAFLAAGFVVAGMSWIAGIIVAIYFTVFYYEVMRSEEKDVRERFGPGFDEYAARVPLFFPRFGKKTDSSAQPAVKFSWAQYHRNREYQALIGTLAALASLWLRLFIHGLFKF